MASLQHSSSNQASSPTQEALGENGPDRRLVSAAILFTVAVLVHGADHVRRGADSLPLDVFWLGTAAIALEVAVVLLVCQRHRLAPLAAVATGLSLALGYVVVHFMPRRSLFSDSFSGGADVSLLSWAAASLEVVAAVALAAAGLDVLRRRGGLASASRPVPARRTWRAAALHPATLAMTIGNAFLLAVSVAQL